MEYTPEKAAEIIAAFNLSPTTNKVWKTRGRIPDRYASGEPTPIRATASTKVEKLSYERLIEVLKNPKIRTKAIFDLIGVNYGKYKDAVRADRTVPLDSTVTESLRLEIKKIQVGFRNFFDRVGERDRLTHIEREKLDNLLSDPRIFQATILGPETKEEKRFLERIFSRKAGKSTVFTEEETAYTRDRIFIFLLEIQL